MNLYHHYYYYCYYEGNKARLETQLVLLELCYWTINGDTYMNAW